MGSYVKGKIVYEKKMRTSGHGKIILKEENTPADRVTDAGEKILFICMKKKGKFGMRKKH